MWIFILSMEFWTSVGSDMVISLAWVKAKESPIIGLNTRPWRRATSSAQDGSLPHANACQAALPPSCRASGFVQQMLSAHFSGEGKRVLLLPIHSPAGCSPGRSVFRRRCRRRCPQEVPQEVPETKCPTTASRSSMTADRPRVCNNCTCTMQGEPIASLTLCYGKRHTIPVALLFLRRTHSMKRTMALDVLGVVSVLIPLVMFGACGSGGSGGAGGSAGGTGKVDGGSGGASGSTLDANVPDSSIQFEVGAAGGNGGAGGSAGGTGKVDGGSGGIEREHVGRERAQRGLRWLNPRCR